MSAGPASFLRHAAVAKLAPVERVPYDHPDFTFRPTPRAPFCCATYSSIEATCPDSCPLKRGGCFAEAGWTRRHGVERDEAARGWSPLDVALHEADLIRRAWGRGDRRVPQDGARGGRDLRLHVAGDAPTDACAAVLGRAATDWRSRGGGRVWTYTHSWADVVRASWGPDVQVLASVERGDQVPLARARGYAPALIVERFPRGPRYFDLAGTRFIPCPAESRGTTCVECRICLDHDLAARGLGIAFEAHGQDKDQVLVALGTRGGSQ